jgi:hypothetical protein
MWGLQIRAWGYECAFRGFIKECTLCFLENIGRKVEKNKILERFKGDSSSSIRRRRRRRRRLQLSVTSCHFRPPLIEKLLLEKHKTSTRKMEEGFSISLSLLFSFCLSTLPLRDLCQDSRGSQGHEAKYKHSLNNIIIFFCVLLFFFWFFERLCEYRRG